jgi:hypothetical protein
VRFSFQALKIQHQSSQEDRKKMMMVYQEEEEETRREDRMDHRMMSSCRALLPGEPVSSSSSLKTRQEQQLVREQLSVLLQNEFDYTVEHIPCTRGGGEDPQAEDWRRKICQWGFRVIDHFRLDREVVCAGMNLFDRFLVRYNRGMIETSTGCNCPSCRRDSRTYQLAAMTSLYLAIKMHTDTGSDEESARRKRFRLSSFVELSRGQFGQDDICTMELQILQTLQWKVHPVTPMTFVSYYLTLLPRRELMPRAARASYQLVQHVLTELSRYLTELAVCLDCCHQPASLTAFAAVLASMDVLTYEALPEQVRDVFTAKVQHACQFQEPETLQVLRQTLQRSLWPELLFEECGSSATAAAVDRSSHPIHIAREFGLLDIDRLCYPSPLVSPPASPKANEEQYYGSPVSVTRR